MLSKYRKVNTWIPWEVHASPHDLAGYADDPFPVVDTEIGRLGVAICYDWLFPETIRQIAFNGAEVIDPRFGLHGPLGRDAADGLVDAVQPRPRGGEHRLRGGRQPGGQPGALPAVQLARAAA